MWSEVLAGTERENSQPALWESVQRHFDSKLWLSPLLLILATLLATVAIYANRSLVNIDIGDYYDSAFLPNLGQRGSKVTDFHAREVGVASPQVETIDWPSDALTVDIAGNRRGIWQATIEAAEGQANRVLHDTALTVNDVRVSIVRRTDREMIVLIPENLAQSEQLSFRLAPPLNGDPFPPAGLAGKIHLTQAVTYRWTSDDSTIELPLLGRGDWQVTLNASVMHPDNAPINTTIYANDRVVAKLPEGGPRNLSFIVPADAVNSGSLTLRITADPYTDPRPLGILLYNVRLVPAGTGLWLPPLLAVVYALLAVLGLWVCLWRLLRKPNLAALISGVVMLLGAYFFAQKHYPAAQMLAGVAGLMIWSVVLLLSLELLMRWINRAAHLRLSELSQRWLLLIFFVAYWAKAGGMLYPYFIGIDVSWHMDKMLQIKAGNLSRFYGTDSPLNEITMPTAEWGENRPVIPYSPWFHIFAVLFTYVPLPVVFVANMFHALVDSSRSLLIAILARKLGLSQRKTLFASLLYTVTPSTYLLLSWGNVPTAFGMWLSLLSAVFIVTAYKRLYQPKPFLVLTFFLLAAMLIYTVMAAFTMLFVGILVVGLWFFDRENRRSVGAIALSAVLAVGLSMLIYYGQYIQPILEQTVPYLLRVGSSDTSVGLQNREPFLTYLMNYWPRMDYLRASGSYGLQLAVCLGTLGLFHFRERRAQVVFVAWLAVSLIFLVVGSRISMVDKHLFFAIPALAVGFGWTMGELWKRGRFGQILVWSIYAFTFFAALNVWIYRIISVRQ